MSVASFLEPLLDWDDIQGNILGGFNKDHQTVIGLKLSGNTPANRHLTSLLAKRVTPLREVQEFKAARRARLLAESSEPSDLKAVWTAAAFSFQGLCELSSEANLFTDLEFRQGLANSSVRLGDPDEITSSWIVGGPGAVPDVLVIIAGDNAEDLDQTVEAFLAEVREAEVSVIYRETGHDLSHYSDEVFAFPSGHEHFGFKDGVSQPGVRGLLPSGEFLTPRTVPNDADENTIEYSDAGQPLVSVGQFLLGFAQQNDAFPRAAGVVLPLAPLANAIGPAWAANGSFLVFRRLRQDVAAFRAFTENASSSMGLPAVGPERVAAMLVGRWPSGAPLMRTPVQDDPSQATAATINAFAYEDDNVRFGLRPDGDGLICPVPAHIRKVNPRDGETDIQSSSATLTKRILRRGIPYGPPLPSNTLERVLVDRGLLFLSYQSSISGQFEFLCSHWMNNSRLPRNPSAHEDGLGFDMLIGQKQSDRIRYMYVRASADGSHDLRISNQDATTKDWVSPTGGGYFFAPSISAMKLVLSLEE